MQEPAYPSEHAYSASMVYNQDSGTTPGVTTGGGFRSDKLRGQLISVGERFIGFDKTIEDEAVRRKQVSEKRFGDLTESLVRLEKAMNAEIKRRVEANKTLQQLTEKMANQMFERLQQKVHHQLQKIAVAIDALLHRCSALENGLSQIKGDIPSKLSSDVANMRKQAEDLRSAWEAERKQREERDAHLLKRLSEIEFSTDAKFETEMRLMEEQLELVRREIEGLARIDSSVEEQFRGFTLEELSALKNGLALCTQSREQADDEIVQSINHYTNVLHKCLRGANTR
uniref:SF-assemblin n=1 Tax=Chromera velia CCMP2878 TaxID=1169474 RepID=A0A0G4IBE9_9ALVE|eukprot:Cvel_12806.t1-p1 / transcript=Cvel_12806.t1 / gene=Cvel_12806 / organism=Chromera_velia_CCMP2878 / gene_product=SF-assemblin, putative / transcript_product=SF-assemblin, putative / location=Cvel_scaffold853:27897-28748(-) / protein_length=284 / sequence_SO=supercontig / SO=protein_coding / is_pseudo=false